MSNPAESSQESNIHYELQDGRHLYAADIDVDVSQASIVFESFPAGLETPMTFTGGQSGSSNCSPFTNDGDEIVNLESASGNVNSASYKRAQRLIRNREAAKRNRMKKKDWIVKLQETNQVAKETNANLKKRLAELETEYQIVQSSMIDNQSIDHNAVRMSDIAPSADFSTSKV